MSERNLLNHPTFENAQLPGAKRACIPACRPSVSLHYGDDVWAEMLSRIGSKLCRLEGIVGAISANRIPSVEGTKLFRELERERSRISRELHAGAGQPLSGMKLNLEILREFAPEFPQSAQQALNRLEVLVEQALQQVRAVSHRLHPPAWQQLSTAGAIHLLVQSSGATGQIEINFQGGELRREPSHAIKVALYRSAQECLSNIIRHSGATKAEFRLMEFQDCVSLRVSDNGHGFTTDVDYAGIGLKALQEHAEALSGSCMVNSSLSGTTIVISIPFSEDENSLYIGVKKHDAND